MGVVGSLPWGHCNHTPSSLMACIPKVVQRYKSCSHKRRGVAWLQKRTLLYTCRFFGMFAFKLFCSKIIIITTTIIIIVINIIIRSFCPHGDYIMGVRKLISLLSWFTVSITSFNMWVRGDCLWPHPTKDQGLCTMYFVWFISLDQSKSKE